MHMFGDQQQKALNTCLLIKHPAGRCINSDSFVIKSIVIVCENVSVLVILWTQNFDLAKNKILTENH